MTTSETPPTVSPTPRSGPVALDHYRSLLVAVQFLTRLPTPAVALGDEAERRAILGRSAAYFPLVGALIGAMTGATIRLAGHFWPIGLAVVIGLAFEALLTGAFHEDAVADFCDAFGGGWTRDDILRILKDSRVGSFGALGLGLAVALRGGAIATLGSRPAHRRGDGVGHARTLGDPAGDVGAASGGRSREPQPRHRPPDRSEASGTGNRDGSTGLRLARIHQPRPAGHRRARPSLVLIAWLVRYVGRRLGGMNGD